MSSRSHIAAMALVCAAAFTAPMLPAPVDAPAAANAPAYDDMRWRLIGPFRGGWATAAAGVAGDPATNYFGSADGGVWKSTDAGVTWRPLFNEQTSASIGALAVAPGDPRVIWAGTGQVHQRWDITDGDGVYRSTDAGATWAHLGLAQTRHIGAVWVDPRRADTAVVAALGHVFGPNAERGVFRTTDGGRTWAHVVSRGPDVGAVDVTGDPAHPDVLYASLWHVRRHPWLDYFQPPVGPGGGIVRSDDAGATWNPVPGSGLPGGDLGRIELAVAPGTASRKVWAAVQAREGGGLYLSEDAGRAWRLVNDDESLASDYMSHLTPDPKDPQILWAVGRSLRVSRDAGRTFRVVRGSPGGDDYHSLWIDPADPRHMVAAADQGAVVTLNGGESWSSWYNQPTGQFYRLGFDDAFPYRIYSGQQDSGTVGILSRGDHGQITFRDWHPVGGDERDGDIPDPADPRIVYGAGLGGRLSRWDARTGQVQNVAPWPVSTYGERPGSGRYRYDWITPLAIDPRPPHAIYLGAQVLFRSRDGGRSWQTVSPDLTGAKPGEPGCDGDVPVQRATACGFGTIFAIAPSPAASGVVWVGTDNGRVLITRDDSATWKDVTPPGLADWTKVNQIDASASDPATAYVAADAHRRDDFRPMAWRTHDGGATWSAIGRGLPAGAWVNVIRQDPRRPGLLYAGTSRGVHVSFDDGESWQSLQLNLPTSGVNDLGVKGDDLVAATQGRAIWILDQLGPLRAGAASRGGPALIQPGRTWRARGNLNKDTPLPPEEPRGENPPEGAILDYVLPDGIAGPVVLEIRGPDGRLVRRFASDDPPDAPEAEIYFSDLFLGGGWKVAATAGHHRFAWDLRHPRPEALAFEYAIAAVPGRRTPVHPRGALVLPGTYRVGLIAAGRTLEQPLVVEMDPRVTAPREHLSELLAFQKQVEGELSRSAAIERRRRAVAEHLASLREATKGTRRQAVQRAQAEFDALAASAESDPGRANEALAALATDLESSDALPTQPQREMLRLYATELGAFEARWSRFVNSHRGVLPDGTPVR